MKKNVLSWMLLFFLINGFLMSGCIVSACTGFVAIDNELVLTGHNKDWWSPDTYIHVYPPEADSFGRIFFEIPYPIIINNNYHVLAGGMNEQGLFYESYVTPLLFASFEPFKPPLFLSPVTYLMETCSTVDEVIAYLESHNLFFLNYLLCSGQLFVIDKTGDAAIIEGDMIIRKEGNFQVCTNFLQSNPDLGNYPCWRYETACLMLENMTEVTVSYVRSILNATHQEGFTQYSTICDLQEGIIHLHHFHNYSKSIQLNLQEEINKGKHSYYLPSLFEPETNQAPLTPQKPTGPTSGVKKEPYIFETNTSDRDNKNTQLYFKWDFGDNTQTYWIINRAPYWGKASHIWKKPGTYLVKAKARDMYGKESEWSEPLEITIQSTQSFRNLAELFFKNA
jgi:PKD domain-containing protein